jgi:hypothetical protein
MNPEQHQYPIDYLNQIAPTPQKAGPSRKTFMILVGLGVFTFIVVSLVIFSGLSAGPKTDMEHLAARLTTLKTIATDAQQNIKSSQLRSTNGGFALSLSNTNRDIVAPLASAGINTAKLSKNILALESGDKITAKLEDARLNAVYDGAYAHEMSYQLAITISLMDKIYTSSSNQQVKDFLQATDKNFEPIKKQFDDFNPTDS